VTSRKTFVIVTAMVEIATGSALLVLPALVVTALLGVRSAPVETLVVARILGSALLAIGVTCALARADVGTTGRSGLAGILLYDVLVALVLAYAGLSLALTGVALWPAVALHTILAIWGLVSLRDEQPRDVC
jgi:hypothetical protein